jgi:hypothetical protein
MKLMSLVYESYFKRARVVRAAPTQGRALPMWARNKTVHEFDTFLNPSLRELKQFGVVRYILTPSRMIAFDSSAAIHDEVEESLEIIDQIDHGYIIVKQGWVVSNDWHSPDFGDVPLARLRAFLGSYITYCGRSERGFMKMNAATGWQPVEITETEGRWLSETV